MAKAGEITVHVADLPQVQALLDDLQRRVAAAEAVVEAARTWRQSFKNHHGPAEWDEPGWTLIAAVDALDGAS